MFRRIVVATDFSETAETAWAVAMDLALTHQSEVVLAHVFVDLPVYPEVAVVAVQRVWEEQREWVEGALGERVAAARGRGVQARWLLKTGSPTEGIVEAAREEAADLLVVGTHGRSGVSRLVIGSVAERVVRSAPCPVLIVKPQPRREAGQVAA
jgi:nucleotide-binding universal stress UspA family protein